MSKEIGPRERQLREMRESKFSKPISKQDIRDRVLGCWPATPPEALRDKVAAIKPKAKKAKKHK